MRPAPSAGRARKADTAGGSATGGADGSACTGGQHGSCGGRYLELAGRMNEAEKAYQYFVIAVPENEEQAKAYFWARKALQLSLIHI